MKKNMSNLDRVFRIIVAGILIGMFYADIISGIWGILALAVAGIFVATSFINFCPLYSLFGISTRKQARE